VEKRKQNNIAKGYDNLITEDLHESGVNPIEEILSSE